MSPLANELLNTIRELLGEVFLTAMTHLVELDLPGLNTCHLLDLARYISSFGFLVIAKNLLDF